MATPARGRARLWIFRLLALVFPLGLIAVLELVLRLAGSGYPTHFFLSVHQSGTNTPGLDANRSVWIENQRFGRRFFPAAIARTPEPLLIAQPKPQNTCRIFVFGESAAMGDPAPEHGFSRILEVLLRDRYPGVAFEVVNVAMTAINSHVIREIAKDCARLQGDVWIVYMGNNEVVGPYGSGTVFTSQAPGLAFIRASIALKATRIGQWLDSLRQRGSRFAEWEGMEMFLRQQVRADDPKMTRVYAHFQRNLEDMVGLASTSGAQILVSTVASNLKDCPPFASLHKPGLGETQRAEWQQLFEVGNKLATEQKFAEALAPFQSAARIDPDYAELPFLMGRCLLALGKPGEARQSFARARDLDTLRFRANTRLDEIIRQVAAANSRVKLLDAVRVFEQQTSNSVVGEEFFHEHVHLNFAGNYLLACSMEKQLEPLLPAWVQKTGPATGLALAAEECARRLALTDWNRLQIAEEVRKRLLQPPFTNQWGHLARDQRWSQIISKLKAAEDPANLQRAAKEARLAVQQAPSDWRLRRNLARLLEAAGDTKEAAGEWREVQRLLPQGVEAPFHLGNLAQGLGRNGEAAEYFREVLRRKPEAVEALNGLGLVLAAEGQTSDAV
ncbi:MAG: tetratricopeptide repeat protein, partial [Verrucomicrobia bacterium]|nr:tetratricopeptide repeat protein [Verrucomicrobiota bacterium]